MKPIKFFFLSFCLFSFGFAYAQTVKPKFKKFILVSYRPSGKGDKKFIRIEDYQEINSEGMVRDIYTVFEDYYGALSFKGKMADTNYAAPDSLIIRMNEVFADDKELDQQKLYKKTSQDDHFAGPFEFISYTDMLGKTHNFIMVDDSQVDKNLAYILDKLSRLPFPAIKQPGKVYRNTKLEALILQCHNTNKDLPEIVAPPAIMELK